MSFVTIALIAIALAMDAFAVSITSGVTIKKMHLHHALRIAGLFGLFQAIMPVAGWSVGRIAADFVQNFDHWIAFALLLFVGIKMIYEAAIFDKDNDRRSDPLNLYILLTLAFATSIDAAAVGITMSFLNVAIIQPALIIGVITFCISFAGIYIGNKFGDLFGKKIEIIGGLVLIGIGVKIVIEHLFFS
jgi:manganese efflux pump family protein